MQQLDTLDTSQLCNIWIHWIRCIKAFAGKRCRSARHLRTWIPLASRGARPEHVQTGRWVVCPARLPRWSAVSFCPPWGAASATGGGCAPLSFSAGTSVRMSTRAMSILRVSAQGWPICSAIALCMRTSTSGPLPSFRQYEVVPSAHLPAHARAPAPGGALRPVEFVR